MTAVTPAAASDRTVVATSHTLPVVGAIVKRSMVRMRRMPSAFLPSLAMPVFRGRSCSPTRPCGRFA